MSLASSASTAQNWERLTGTKRQMLLVSNTVSESCTGAQHKPVVTNSCKPGDVQHQRGVQWAGLGRFALRWRRAFVTQHAGASHPPQLGALPRLLHNNQSRCHDVCEDLQPSRSRLSDHGTELGHNWNCCASHSSGPFGLNW